MGISKNLIEAVVVCEKSSDLDSFILRNCNFIAMNFLAQINVDYPGRRPQAPACFKYNVRPTDSYGYCLPTFSPRPDLVGDWTNPFQKICTSNWIMKPQGSGFKVKHIWNHHPPNRRASKRPLENVHGSHHPSAASDRQRDSPQKCDVMPMPGKDLP